MGITEDLQAHFGRLDAAPFLFVGSGVSRRYLGAPDWTGLLRHFAERCGKPFERYRGEADGDYPTIASLIAKDFQDIWWSHDDYAEQRTTFAAAVADAESALKIAISQLVEDAGDSSEALKEELELLGSLTVDGIITTNYNTLMESLFPDYRVYVGQKALLSNRPAGIAEIFKIHGCSSEPNSIVISRRDYDTFDRQNPYLAAKLSTIFMENPVVFLGYSLSDRNIQAILANLVQCLDGAALSDLRDRLIFVDWSPTPIEPVLERSQLSIAGTVLPIVLARSHEFASIFSGMRDVQRQFPAKLLRQLRNHVYELVRSTDDHQLMHVVDIDADNVDLDEINVVFGVGGYTFSAGSAQAQPAEKGYQMYSQSDLMRHVVFGAPDLDPVRVVRETFPSKLKANSWTPVHGFVQQAGIPGDELDPKIVTALTRSPRKYLPSPKNYWSRGDDARQLGSVEAVRGQADLSPLHETTDLLLLRWNQLDLEQLAAYLQERFDEFINHEHQTVRANFRKLVCLFDRLRSGGEAIDGPDLT